MRFCPLYYHIRGPMYTMNQIGIHEPSGNTSSC